MAPKFFLDRSFRNCFFRSWNWLSFYFSDKKALFSQNFMSLSRPSKKYFLDRSFRICPLKNCFFFVPKINFHFIFSGIKNSYAEKSAVFAEFHEFLSFSKFFFGNIFKYVKKKSAIFAENMKKVCVCVVSKKCNFRSHLESN